MRYHIYFLFCFCLIFFSPIFGGNNFGYISHTSSNIGDDIQAIAAKRFLPKKSIGISREFIGEFTSSAKIKTILNGWFMYTKNVAWYLNDIPAPKKSWPPAPCIDPLILSLHITPDFIPYAFSDRAVAYLKQHGPVGARDYRTLDELQKRGIPSYFSGCLTLTLENDCTQRDDIIYAVDVDDECVQYIQSKTTSKVERLTHSISYNLKHRLQYAQAILEKYKRARCVITPRLHATMPCLAFQTPVLLLGNHDDPRFDGLRELATNCTKEELLSGAVNFDFDNPPQNPTLYLPLRERLINIVTNWVKNNSATDNIPNQAPITKQLKPLDVYRLEPGLDWVDCVYVINLDQRPEKWKRIKTLFDQRGIAVNRVSAINGWKIAKDVQKELAGIYPVRLGGGQLGCLLSHLSVLHDAYQREFDTIWVCEDDIEFCDDVRKIPELVTKLSQLDPEWDVLYTDVDSKDSEGNYVQSLGSDFRPHQPSLPVDFYTQRILIDDDIMNIRQRFGLYSVLFSRRGIKKILDYFTHQYLWSPIDIDIHYIPGIREYSATQDIVSVWSDSHISDTEHNCNNES